jgi:hypothetical protein
MAETSKRAMSSILPLVACGMLATACASSGKGHTYKLYPGPRRTLDELAVVGFGERVRFFRIDGMLVAASDYDRVELVPGSYLIDWRAKFDVGIAGSKFE